MSNKRKKSVFIKAMAAAMVFIMAALPVAAAGTHTADSKWGDTTYLHKIDVTQKVIRKGIDVSSYQDDIDWTRVVADEDADVSFAFIRMGYSRYADDQTATYFLDEMFADNLSEALTAGLDCGAYFFSRAITEAEAITEAQWLVAELEQLGFTPEDLALPIMFDYEYEYDYDTGAQGGRLYNANLTSAQKTSVCNAFLQVLLDAGYEAGVYGNRSMFTENARINTDNLIEGSDVWLSQYSTQATFDKTYDFWQFTDVGTVDGINGPIDCNFGYFPVEDGQGYHKPSDVLTGLNYQVEEGQISISWDLTDDADGYVILKSSRWGGAFELLVDMGPIEYSNFSYMDDVDPDYEYYYMVYPYIKNSDGTRVYGQGSDIMTASVKKGTKTLITTSSVRLRAHAGTGDIPVVYQLPKGAILDWKVDTKASNGVVWNKVSYTADGKTYSGYVSSAYTREYQEPLRISGKTRYETAFGTADQLKEALGVEKFDNIVVATGMNFADALSGSYLAYVKNAPILLTADAYEQKVQSYIRANLAEGGTVYLLGGDGAISLTMEKGLAGLNVKRLSGKTRYDTNLEILKEANVTKEDILVCTATKFADSLSASAAKRPILLVGSSLNDNQKEYLEDIDTKQYYVIGGSAAVSENVEAQMKAYGDVERIGGKSRYETSTNVAKAFVSGPNKAVLAYSMNYPDGLCGGPLAMALNAPLVLTQTGSEAAATAYTKEMGISEGYVLGGTKLISDTAVKKILGHVPEKIVITPVTDDPYAGMTNGQLYEIYFASTYGPQNSETFAIIETKLMERAGYMQKSAYYVPLSRYWEDVRGVTDIGNQIDPLYYTSMKFYTAEDFAQDPVEVIKIAKNEIYARHGYIFGNKDLYNYFMGCAWYEPTVPASKFDTSVFNAYEVHNLSVLNSLDK